jgi:hypothetical protein
MTGMSSAQRDAEARAASAPTTADPSAVTFDQFAKTYIERGPQERAKTSWKDDEYLLTAVRKELGASTCISMTSAEKPVRAGTRAASSFMKSATYSDTRTSVRPTRI